MNDHQRGEFDELLAAMREGTIDADGIARLESLARESSELCRLYIEHVRLAADLKLDYDSQFIERSLARVLEDGGDDCDSDSGLDESSGGKSEKSPILGFLGDVLPTGQNPFPRLPGILVALAIVLPLLLLGAIAIRSSLPHNDPEKTAAGPTIIENAPLPAPPEPRPYVARLTKAADCVWAEKSKSARPDLLLRSGERLQLEKGRLEISFFDGARLVAKGPVVIECKSPDSAVLHRGAVRVRADSDALGFTLLTPRVAVVDMGTEFGVAVDDTGRANVDVFEGQVLAQVMDSSGTVSENIPITEGRAVRFEEETAIALDHSTQPSDEVTIDALPSGYPLWRTYSEALAQDPDMIAYYPFDDRRLEDGVLHNHSLRGELLDGQIVHAKWTEGRWPEKDALEFSSREDRVLINLPGEYEELSMAAWVRLDGAARKPASLLHSDGHVWDNPGVIHWMINPLHSTHFAFVDADKRVTNCFSRAGIAPSESPRWYHFAAVYDMKAGTVTQYVDGYAAGCQQVDRPRRLRIAGAQIGNSSIDKPLDDRHLAGRIDELMIFQRVLSAAEIRYMHSIGRPEE